MLLCRLEQDLVAGWLRHLKVALKETLKVIQTKAQLHTWIVVQSEWQIVGQLKSKKVSHELC